MIEVFTTQFNKLYPNCIVLKFHVLIHLPTRIKLFEPVRQQWCFHFESMHACFKGLASIVKSFKNMALGLCYRQQSSLCSKLSSNPNMLSKRFLHKGDYVASRSTILLSSLPFPDIFRDFVTEADCEMMHTAKIITNGTKYRQGKSFFLLAKKMIFHYLGKWPNCLFYET